MWRSKKLAKNLTSKLAKISSLALGAALAIGAVPAGAAESSGKKLKIVKGGIEIALASDGLVIIDPKTGKRVPMPFGTSWRLSNSIVYYATGDRPFNSVNAECGAGTVEFSRFDRITLNFQSGKFSGWSVGPANPAKPLKTVNGVGRDSSRVELASMAGFMQVSDSTLGDEFVLNPDGSSNLTGLFNGPGSDAKVTDLWAGTSCIFR